MALGLRLGATARGERNTERGTCRGFKKIPGPLIRENLAEQLE